jgi:hypothetical protein
LKQIISTVTFLPVIEEPTVFNILAYTTESAEVPADEWLDTDPLAIESGKSQQVKLRSFSTDVHRIEAMVAYRFDMRLTGDIGELGEIRPFPKSSSAIGLKSFRPQNHVGSDDVVSGSPVIP